MSDAPILSPLNHVTKLDTASDFELKHTPYVTAERDGDRARVTVKVGHYVPHPNQPDHYIQWIMLYVDDAPIARIDLSPVATDPDACVVVAAAPGKTLRAVEYCNLHGLWAAEVEL